MGADARRSTTDARHWRNGGASEDRRSGEAEGVAMSLHFNPDPAPLLNATVMVSCLRGRIITRQALLPQSQGDDERLKHERAIAEYEAEIERLQGAVT